jgi:hypothetical protein
MAVTNTYSIGMVSVQFLNFLHHSPPSTLFPLHLTRRHPSPDLGEQEEHLIISISPFLVLRQVLRLEGYHQELVVFAP